MFLSKDSGFTLTEFLVAFLISTFILVTVGIIISDAFVSWGRGERKVALDRESAYAVMTIERVVRESSDSQVSEDESALELYLGGNETGRFWVEDETLRASFGGGDAFNLTEERVENFIFALDEEQRTVTITELTLFREEESARRFPYLSSTVSSTTRHRIDW